ncbi:MAG TPA: MFS transporter [Victivallales bacterium]|nr:MFS transporter [Victivallales bacterium]
MKKLGYSQLFIVIFFSFGGFIGGYLLCVINGAAPFLINDFKLSTYQISTIMGLILFGGLIAKVILIFQDYFGRKKLIYINLVLFIVGILLFTSAHNYELLYWGRLIQGAAAIMSTVVFTVYLSEIAPSNRRGIMIVFFQLAWTAGMFIANIVNISYVKTGNWELMFNFIIFIPVIMLIFTPFLPRSPRWLVLRGRFNEAKEIITGINYKMNSDNLKIEIESVTAGSEVKWLSSFALIFKYKKAILFTILIFVLTQLCGVNAIMQTSTIVLKDCGIQSTFMAVFGTVLISGFNFIMTIGTILLVEKLGRKRILKIGLYGFTISMFALAIIVGVMPKIELTGWLALICMLVGIGFLAFGPCGVVYVLIAEVLPTSVRTVGIIIGGISSIIVGTIFVSKFLIIGNTFGFSVLFGMMGAFALIYLLFSIFKLPETGGKSLEEIESDIS